MSVKLSYIVPAYNAGLYIQKTLDGIFVLPLSEEELEVIVIDDCSTDGTLEVLESIKKRHPNLVLLHQEINQRQGAARNRGIEIAKGEYIAFCDADDEIVADGVMNALYAVEKSHVDICYFDFEYEEPNGEKHLFEMPQETHNTILSASDYLNNYYTCYYNAPWRNLYRADFLRKTGIRFVEGVRWEDCDWTVKVYAKAKEIQFVDGVGYRYVQNGTNTCSLANTPNAMGEQLYAGLRLIQYAGTIANKLPRLSGVLYEEACNKYVMGLLRIRNISKYAADDIKLVYKSIGDKNRAELCKYKFTIWVNYVLAHPRTTLLLLSIISLIARLGRHIMVRIRNL